MMILIIITLTTLAGPWNNTNNPLNLQKRGDRPLKYHWNELPQNGSISNGFSGDYWPHSNRGVARMHQGKFDLGVVKTLRFKETNQFRKDKLKVLSKKLKSANSDVEYIVQLSKEEVRLLDNNNKKKLPACFKLDYVAGRFDWPLTRRELVRTSQVARSYAQAQAQLETALREHNSVKESEARAVIKNLYWQGICNGWSASSIKEGLPKDCQMQDTFGEMMPFNSSDIKGLLALLYAHYSDGKDYHCGIRCDNKMPDNASLNTLVQTPNFMDIHPASFYLLLANKIGLQNSGIIINAEPAGEVWNQPVTTFSVTANDISNVAAQMLLDKVGIGHHSLPHSNTVRQRKLDIKVGYLVEVDAQSKKEKAMRYENYSMLLEFDFKDKVIGGRWINNSIKRHPGFVWDTNKVDPMNSLARNYFGAPFKKLLDLSTGQLAPVPSYRSAQQTTSAPVLSSVIRNPEPQRSSGRGVFSFLSNIFPSWF